jgi:hypothetical protein
VENSVDKPPLDVDKAAREPSKAEKVVLQVIIIHSGVDKLLKCQ